MHAVHVRSLAGGGVDRQLPETFTAVSPRAQIGWLSFAIHKRGPTIQPKDDNMAKAVNLIAPDDVLAAIQAEASSGDILWSESEPMNSPLNPLDDPLGGIPLDYICHVVTVVLQTGTAGATFATAVAKLVSQMKKSVQVRDTKTNEIVITVTPGTPSKEIEDSIPADEG